MNKLMKLSQLPSGESGVIFKIDLEDKLKNKLKSYGIEENNSIICLFDALKDSSRTYTINGLIFKISPTEASKIYISKKISDWNL